MLMHMMLLVSVAQTPEPAQFVIEPQHSGTAVSLRGLSVVSHDIAWASGTDGTCLRTIDAGQHWQRLIIPDSAELDFRDIAAFDAHTAVVLSAGLPAVVFKTIDGGKNWNRCYHNITEGVFFDALAFWDVHNGIAFSDPVEGRFLIITTSDGGSSWQELDLEQRPTARAGEAGFAASGTCLSVFGQNHVWIGTGGAQARILRSVDRGLSWTAAATPIISGKPSTGIFSVAFRDALHGVAVGGDYTQDTERTRIFATTMDGGVQWTWKSTAQPRGYRSCVAYVPNALTPTLVAVGPSGCDVSTDDGRTWRPLTDEGYHTIAFSRNGVGWMIGAGGRVAKIRLSN